MTEPDTTSEVQTRKHETMDPHTPTQPATAAAAGIDAMHPAATFTVSRDELLGSDPLLGSAEIARTVCRGAERMISVLSITRERMRRIDGWLGAVGFVTHSAGPDPSVPLLGSVCDRDVAGDLVGSMVESLVGPLPTAHSSEPVTIDAVGALAPGAMPSGLDWVVVVTALDGAGAPSHTMVGTAPGLVMATDVRIDEPATLRAVDVDDVRVRLAELVGSPPRSVRELLVDD